MPEMEHDGTKLHSGGSCNVNNLITNNLKHEVCYLQKPFFSSFLDQFVWKARCCTSVQ